MEAVLKNLRKLNMSVPNMSQLRHGVGVNIVLKADQPSGRLTTGHIAQILTKGNHPRGIKVRLNDGQIGRVQSLSSAAPIVTSSPHQNEVEAFERSIGGRPNSGDGRRTKRDQGKYTMQEDYRNDEIAADSRSLADYMKVPRKQRNRKTDAKVEENTVQAQLESEFPKLDAALIAAIVADHADTAEARDVLKALS